MGRPAPIDREARFGIEELFFSTTDAKGHIRAGNDVFVRVSGYPEDTLVGSAHSIIRHPDMPRAVFRLLWDRLLAGEPIAAYVKNMAADGSWYWVMATVVPSAGGFLSVRLRPSSPVFAAVGPLYAELRAAEREMEKAGLPRGEVVDASVARLGDLISAAGFADYDTFMREALPGEIRAREESVGAVRQPSAGAAMDGLTAAGAELSSLFANVAHYAEVNRTLAAGTGFIRTLAEDVRLSATNGLVAAARLDGRGATLSVVADQMSRCASDIAAVVDALSDEIAGAVASLRDLAFRISIAKVQVDMGCAFAAESGGWHVVPPETAARRRESMAELVGCLAGEVDAILAALPALDGRLEAVRGRIGGLDRALRLLNALHVSGRVEVAAVPEAAGFRVLFDHVRDQLEGSARHMGTLRSAAAAGTRRSCDEAALREGIARAGAEEVLPAAAAA